MGEIDAPERDRLDALLSQSGRLGRATADEVQEARNCEDLSSVRLKVFHSSGKTKTVFAVVFRWG